MEAWWTASSIKISIDREECISCGACWQEYPVAIIRVGDQSRVILPPRSNLVFRSFGAGLERKEVKSSGKSARCHGR
jgi:ferredoxin